MGTIRPGASRAGCPAPGLQAGRWSVHLCCVDGSARMAVTPTFPSRDSLRRLRFRPVDVTVGVGVLLLIYAVVRVGAGARAPFHPGQSVSLISTSPSELPYYAARSLLRMFVALF